jgi:hypothetical protein
MCNLYSMTTNQAAIRDLFRVTKDSAGNLPPITQVRRAARHQYPQQNRPNAVITYRRLVFAACF